MGTESLVFWRCHPPCSQTLSGEGSVRPRGSGELWPLHAACALRCCLAPLGQCLLTIQQLPASTGASPAHQAAASLFCLALPGVMRNKSRSLPTVGQPRAQRIHDRAGGPPLSLSSSFRSHLNLIHIQTPLRCSFAGRTQQLLPVPFPTASPPSGAKNKLFSPASAAPRFFVGSLQLRWVRLTSSLHPRPWRSSAVRWMWHRHTSASPRAGFSAECDSESLFQASAGACRLSSHSCSWVIANRQLHVIHGAVWSLFYGFQTLLICGPLNNFPCSCDPH